MKETVRAGQYGGSHAGHSMLMTSNFSSAKSKLLNSLRSGFQTKDNNGTRSEKLFIYAQSECKSFVSCVLNVCLFIFCSIKCQSLFFPFEQRSLSLFQAMWANLPLKLCFVDECVNIWIEHMGKVLSRSYVRTLLFCLLIGRIVCRCKTS